MHLLAVREVVLGLHRVLDLSLPPGHVDPPLLRPRRLPLDAARAIAFTPGERGTPAEQFPVSVAGRVADQLRDLIRDGAYAPGARLVERAIARELGTSHIPVREALARLAEEGLVVRLPRRGARVAELSPRLLEEISSVRVVLEQFVCRRVLERWTTVGPGRARCGSRAG